MFTRTQLSLGVTVIVFAAVMLLTMLYRLMGDVVTYGAAAAILTGLLVWFIDYTSERWNKKEG